MVVCAVGRLGLPVGTGIFFAGELSSSSSESPKVIFFRAAAVDYPRTGGGTGFEELVDLPEGLPRIFGKPGRAILFEGGAGTVDAEVFAFEFEGRERGFAAIFGRPGFNGFEVAGASGFEVAGISGFDRGAGGLSGESSSFDG